LYDLSVHSSRFMVEKWGLKTGPSLKVLGSARYCREWLAKLRDWIPDAPGLPSGPGLRLVLFLPKPDFIVDWVELEQVMSFLAALPETVFVVKAHPRRGGRHRLVRRGEDWDMEITELAGRDAVERFSAESGEGKWISAPPETESSSLVKWADAVLSLGTSVTWQAVAENKPVLELSWCHGNFTTMAKYLPSTDLRCRDDLLNTLGQIRNAESRSFYRPGEREAFIESFIEADGQADDGTVLDAYDTVLGQLCASRSSGATGG
jgi:hypothetical protein